MDLGLEGKVAMVAAASKGIGLAIARALAREGAAVSICARSEEGLAGARAELESVRPGARVLPLTCDVAQAADLERWYGRTVEILGEVDILVTSTGGPPAARFTDLSDEQWSQGIASTLMNVVRLSRLVIPAMRQRKWGRIIHLTSLAAKQPIDLLTISSTLRAGLSGLTKTMANQLAPDGILVNAVLPGHVWTDRQVHLAEIRAREESTTIEAYRARIEKSIPLRRFARAEEIGDAVAFLASERASYLTGVSLQVDGGIIQGTF